MRILLGEPKKGGRCARGSRHLPLGSKTGGWLSSRPGANRHPWPGRAGQGGAGRGAIVDRTVTFASERLAGADRIDSPSAGDAMEEDAAHGAL